MKNITCTYDFVLTKNTKKYGSDSVSEGLAKIPPMKQNCCFAKWTWLMLVLTDTTDLNDCIETINWLKSIHIAFPLLSLPSR